MRGGAFPCNRTSARADKEFWPARERHGLQHACAKHAGGQLQQASLAEHLHAPRTAASYGRSRSIQSGCSVLVCCAGQQREERAGRGSVHHMRCWAEAAESQAASDAVRDRQPERSQQLQRRQQQRCRRVPVAVAGRMACKRCASLSQALVPSEAAVQLYEQSWSASEDAA